MSSVLGGFSASRTASSRACGSTGPASTAATAIEPERSPLDPSRGVLLMRALVDRLAFVLDDDGRHRVTPEKSLHISPKLRLLPQ
jgi:hypothetical protein